MSKNTYAHKIAMQPDEFTEILQEIEERGDTYSLVGEGEDPVGGSGGRNMRLMVNGVATPIFVSFGGGDWHAQADIGWETPQAD